MDKLTGIGIFARVVEAQSFSAAARQLGLSKSAVSKQISRLEDRLGTRLLNRTTRKLSLTETGIAFYERSVRIIAEAEEAEHAVTQLTAEPRGRLRVNAPMSFGVMHLAPAIGDFLTRFPALEIDMELTDRFVDLVEEGWDLAVRIADLADSSLVARRLAPARRLLCAAPSYLERHGAPRTPADLKQHNCLRYSYLSAGAEWRFQGPSGSISMLAKGNLKTNNGEVLLQAALAGAGLAMLPTFIAGEALKSGRLVAVMSSWLPQSQAIYALYPHRHVSPKVRAFVDFLAARFGPTPYWD